MTSASAVVLGSTLMIMTGAEIRRTRLAVRRALLYRTPLAAAAALVLTVTARAQQPAAQTVQKPPVDSARPAALAFQGTTVVDVESGRRFPGQTVVVVGNRIQAVGAASRVRPPAGARVIRAEGTYVIPGLWDMHIHVMGYPNTFFPLLIANGVTGIRDMGTPFLDSMVRWRREVKAGERVGPRLVTTGPTLVNTERDRGLREFYGPSRAVHTIAAATPEEGRRIVDSLKERGADLIKVYTGLKRSVYFAVAAEARRLGLPIVGHLPDSVSGVEASDSGQHSLEHGYGIEPCFATPPDLKHCREIAAHLARNDTWVLLGPYMGCGPCQLPWYHEQDRYWPDSLYDLLSKNPGTPPHEPQVMSVPLERWAALHTDRPKVQAARAAGVHFLAGTDNAPFGMVVGSLRAGFSLHDLLWDLTNAGLTPLEALRAVTLNPAKFFHATDSMGTVAPGKVADLVFLDADPLQDIFNTRRVRAVVADGRFYDRPDLDSLLVNVERLAKQSRRR